MARVRSRGLRSRVMAIMALCVGALVTAMAVPSGAIPGSMFEGTDGNQDAGDTVSGTDWETFIGSSDLFKQQDSASGSGDNSLAGGTKDNTECPNTTTGSIPNNKDDLLRFYLAHETIGGDTYLYLAYVRALPGTTTASAHAVFELNQSNEKCPSTVKKGQTIESPFFVRTPGDIRIAFDDEGGSTPVISVQRWQEPCESANGNCWGPKDVLDADEAEGAFNDDTVDDLLNTFNSDTSLSPQRFGEMAINMNEAGLIDPDECIGFGAAGLFTGSSGNSDSEQSKDFIAPTPINLQFCQPVTVDVEKTFTATPTSNAVFTLYYDDGDGVLGEDDIELDTCTITPADVVNGEGTCEFDELNLGDGPFDDLGPHTVIVSETTVPNGFNGSADQTVTFSFGPDAQSFTVSFSNSPAPGDVDLKKVDDDDNPLSGAVFTLYDDVGVVGTYEDGTDTTTGRTCTTDATGVCLEDEVTDPTHAFHSLALGDYCVVETSTPLGYDTADPQCFTIGLGSGSGEGQSVDLGDFVDPRQHKIIVLVCHEGTNTLLGSEVTYEGGDEKTSLSTPPADITEEELCTLGGASYGGISGHEERDLTVTPGSHP